LGSPLVWVASGRMLVGKNTVLGAPHSSKSDNNRISITASDRNSSVWWSEIMAGGKTGETANFPSASRWTSGMPAEWCHDGKNATSRDTEPDMLNMRDGGVWRLFPASRGLFRRLEDVCLQRQSAIWCMKRRGLSTHLMETHKHFFALWRLF